MRLKSLDIMRGSIMLFLTIIQPTLLAWIAYCNALGDPLPEAFCRELTHVRWEGWNLWDLVMPTFIFMCGVAIPFAIPKYLTEKRTPTLNFFLHLVWRVATLWLLGMLIQGNLLTLQWEKFYFFTNTLQAIAMGYAVTALAFLIPWRAIRFALPFVFMILYALLLEDHGGYAPANNLAYEVEQALLPALQDDPKYTWILTSLMFSAMTMMGALCGEVLKLSKSWPVKSLCLGGLGLFLLISGFCLESFIPIIKSIYTVSFTSLALGFAVLFLATLYTIIDGLEIRYGFGFVTMFGQNALVAYFLHEFLFFGTLRPLGQRLSASIYHYYMGQPDIALQAKAIPAYNFMGDVMAAVITIALVYLWASRKRALNHKHWIPKDLPDGN